MIARASRIGIRNRRLPGLATHGPTDPQRGREALRGAAGDWDRLPVELLPDLSSAVMAADTRKWEQSAAFALDSHPAVVSWVKNDHLGFAVPYRKRNIAAKYLPDFVVVLDSGLRLIVKIKGRKDDDADVKAKAAERWTAAVNATMVHGRWAYVLVDDSAEAEPLHRCGTCQRWD